MIQAFRNKIRSIVRFTLYSLLPLAAGGWTVASCSDFFDQESDNVIYADKDHLNNWADSVYSFMGIMAKLQSVADRTILLGEVRGDLVTLTPEASADLRQIANFSIDDDNEYNQPRDYYAVINNCNYYIAHADTAQKSNRNQYIFMKEYAAVKAIRAWTYLQLAINYGSVPFFTQPLLTKEESELDYPRYSLTQICQYFIDDLAGLPELYDTEYPNYGNSVRGIDSHLFFFPLNIVRGDLNLWLGSAMGKDAGQPYFRQAAICYYNYISQRNGLNATSYYATGVNFRSWFPGTTSWTRPSNNSSNFLSQFISEAYGPQEELITLIPGDSLRSEANYSKLPSLFNSSADNDYKYSITPSKRMVEISESQVNCCMSSDGKTGTYVPTGLPDHNTGDLRLGAIWDEGYTINLNTGIRTESQTIYKYYNWAGQPFNIHIYRRLMVYLRMAEALNMAGQPRMAFKVLERGLTNSVLNKEVFPYLNETDSTWVKNNFDFMDLTTVNNRRAGYQVLDTMQMKPINGVVNLGESNTMGIHSRGSGYTPVNEYYKLVGDSIEKDPTKYEKQKAEQQQQVDSLILNECALELAFEGTRYYDIMRYAMRQSSPGTIMQQFINARNGKDGSATVQTDLSNTRNWYLKWKGKIGF